MKKPRPDSYEAQLTSDELIQLHALLSTPKLKLEEVQSKAPPWRAGPYAATQPSIAALSRIAAQLRAEEHLLNIEATTKLLETICRKIDACPDLSENLMDNVCKLVGQELLANLIQKGSQKEQLIQLRLLLKREDQRLALAKHGQSSKKGLEVLEAETKKAIMEVLTQKVDLLPDLKPEPTIPAPDKH
jgi:hypothetical protein